MIGSVKSADGPKPSRFRRAKAGVMTFRGKPILLAVGISVTVACLGLTWVAWLGSAALKIKAELSTVTTLVPSLKDDISVGEQRGATETVSQIRQHTAAAKELAAHPLWTLASALPGFGANLDAVTEITQSADDVAKLGLTPLVNVIGSLDWNSLTPRSSGTDLEPLRDAAPNVASAAHAVRVSAERLNQIDATNLLPQVAEPLVGARDQLRSVTGVLDAAADVSRIAPVMLGAESPRNYLLMVQNNAESRASGGIPGALAVLTLDEGTLSLGIQSSATDIGIISPPVGVDPEQQQIYSPRLGTYMQDVNLTPDFPTAARAAKAMWEMKTGQHVDGVLSVDPVALGYVLDATGPVTLTGPLISSLAGEGLPTVLSGDNIVPTLLSNVYAKIEQTQVQDAYFAGVAQEIFASLSNHTGDSKALIDGISRAAREARVLVWSDAADEQAVLGKYSLSGSISGPSVLPAQFGVYFNDGTGAKMDYYVKRTVQLVKDCPRDGYQQMTVRITQTNTAEADAATSLPAYVTGAGAFGVPPGVVQTNVVVYGPVQAVVETAKIDGQQSGLAPYLHANRPVGVVATRLAPGETRTVDMTFGKIVQHTEPNAVVTPTVQNVKDVLLPTRSASCG